MKPRIMYLENKSEGLSGPARIGRVTFSKTRKTIYYKGRSFQSLGGFGSKANYFDAETGEQYWISGPRKDGADRLYGEAVPIEIDEDVREEYWAEIRGLPERSSDPVARQPFYLSMKKVPAWAQGSSATPVSWTIQEARSCTWAPIVA